MGAEKTTIAKGRKTDGEFKQRVSGYEPVKKDYNDWAAKGQKQDNLKSDLFGRPISNYNHT